MRITSSTTIDEVAEWVTNSAIERFKEMGCEVGMNYEALHQVVHRSLMVCHAENGLYMADYYMKRWSVRITDLHNAKTIDIEFKD